MSHTNKPPALSKKETDELKELFAEADKHPDALSDSDRKFLADVGSRFAKFGNGLYVSEKQWKWIEDLQKKVFGT